MQTKKISATTKRMVGIVTFLVTRCCRRNQIPVDRTRGFSLSFWCSIIRRWVSQEKGGPPPYRAARKHDGQNSAKHTRGFPQQCAQRKNFPDHLSDERGEAERKNQEL